MSNPTWTYDEIILSLDFFLRHRKDGDIKPRNDDFLRHVADINRLAIKVHENRPQDEKFRNPNGVNMSLMQFAHLDPTWTINGFSNASILRRNLWTEFSDKPDEVAAMAQAILAHLDEAEKTGKPLVGDISERDIDMLQPSVEGRVLQVSHLRRERNPKLVTQLKDLRFDANGFLDCEVCAFDYERSYGERGHKFMEAHHKKPLSSLKPEGEKIRAEDYALICANCHRMIHRFSPWWSIEELRENIQKDLTSNTNRTTIYQAQTKEKNYER